MPLYVFPDPRHETQDILEANADRWPAGTTVSDEFPTGPIAAPHIQFAWDGTPLEESNREGCAMRFTVWTPRGRKSEANDLASLVRAVFLDGASAGRTWRYTRGTGRLPGVDSTTGLPFCTFTLTAETRPSPVA